MSADMFANREDSKMMAGLLFAMKNTCDCPGCLALRDMSDKMIASQGKKKIRKNKKQR